MLNEEKEKQDQGTLARIKREVRDKSLEKMDGIVHGDFQKLRRKEIDVLNQCVYIYRYPIF